MISRFDFFFATTFSQAVFQRLLSIAVLSLIVLCATVLSSCGQHQDPGVVTNVALPADAVDAKAALQQDSIASNSLLAPDGTNRSEAAGSSKIQKSNQPSAILFGDLHVHSTFSPDAFVTALPIMGGSGSRPPAAACDFARYCSALDFWSINDHAEGLTPLRWQETKDAVRACNAVSANREEPDLVTFLGWEWSQVSHYDAEKHYGHKNVMFLETDDAKVPSRPIAAPRDQLGKSPIGGIAAYMLALRDFDNRGYYQSIQTYYDEIAETPRCVKGLAGRGLPDDCHETAEDPAELFDKLKQWDVEHMVIPHGNAWGLNTPPGTTFDKQLDLTQHSPEQQFLFELYSGHGNSEEYRDWRAVTEDSEGRDVCPEPSKDYEPCCWRAGKIIHDRCIAAGEEKQECTKRDYQARQHYVEAGVSGHLTVPGQKIDDWLNCGQCIDCFNPGMDHRPGTTAQYALAISQFDKTKGNKPQRFRFGFIGSSDNHRSRGGSGYKEFGRFGMTETNGTQSPKLSKMMGGDPEAPLPYSVSLSERGEVGLQRKRNMERQGSFWLTGGLVAVHSDNRQREAIWKGLKNKQVYATSGDRILLWFDLQTNESIYPMGSEVKTSTTPKFVATAIGAFEQKPGCPDYVGDILGAEKLEALCLGECYNPADNRKLIDRIEIVRIRPQVSANEDVAQLIEDPWRSFACEPNQKGCRVEFEDPDYVTGQREFIYYARAIQQASDAINAGQLRCEVDSEGQCISVDPCYGDYRTANTDDCLAPNEERAWSSPIFVSQLDDEN